MTALPAISLWQPWSSLIAIGVKPFETRSWAPSAKHVGRRIAVHASLRLIKPDELGEELHAVCVEHFGASYATSLPRGSVVCTATLRGAYLCGYGIEDDTRITTRHSVPGSPGLPHDLIETDALGDYSLGRWAWHLTDVELLTPPVPARGAQGFWTWREEAIAC